VWDDQLEKIRTPTPTEAFLQADHFWTPKRQLSVDVQSGKENCFFLSFLLLVEAETERANEKAKRVNKRSGGVDLEVMLTITCKVN